MELPLRSLKLALQLSTRSSTSASSNKNSNHLHPRMASIPSQSTTTHSQTSTSSVMSSPTHSNGSRPRGPASTASSVDEPGGHVDLPLDQEFVPMEEARDAADEEDLVRDQVRDDVICMIFDLPRSTKFYQDFSCAVAAMHGRMYPTSTHVCFYSNVFGRERKILIPYESISEITKTTTLMFQNSIRLATHAKEEYTFTSFWGNNRDNCYDLIVKTRNRVLEELRPKSIKRRNKTSDTDQSNSESSTPASPVAHSTPSFSPVSPPTSQTEESECVSPADDEESEDNLDETRALERCQSTVSDVDSVAPKDISMTQVIKEKFPLSVEEFMQTFILDGAKFGFKEFQERTGSTEITCNPWMTTLPEDSSRGMTRSLQFRVPIDAPIGPKSSQVDVVQCCKTVDENARMIESSTRLVDIPYGDYFSVEERWTIVPHRLKSNACTLFIELKVVFSKSTMWKSKIESRAVEDNKAKWEKWVTMAKEFLAAPPSSPASESNLESPPNSSSSHRSSRNGSINQDIRTARRISRAISPQEKSSMVRASMAGRNKNAHLKVFPWFVVLVLLIIVVRMQLSLSNIQNSLELTARRMDEIQSQLSAVAGACPVNR